MTEKIRFHLDEHMDPDISAALRRYDIDITTTAEQDLLGGADQAHLDRARADGRVIVTDDIDFLRIASQTRDHPGIVFCHRRWHGIGEIIRFLLLVHKGYAPEDMVGRVEYL